MEFVEDKPSMPSASPKFAEHFYSSQQAASQPVDHVPLLDVGRENEPLENEILAAITQVTKSGRFVLGPECQQLEQRIAALCGTSHAIGCASGTDALLLALMAIDLKPGDEVIVPSFTFFSTASVIWRLGGVPVFVDINPRTLNLNPELLRTAVTSKTKAIIPVHLFGQAAEMDAINTFAKQHNLAVIEDAAQAIGGSLAGKPTGSLGDIGCFSFYPTKNLGGFGDGGMLTTNSDSLADQLRLLRVHGMQPRYYHGVVGTNSRLDTIQAAVLNVKLPNLTLWTAARQENADRYYRLFHESGLLDQIVLPRVSSGHVWNQYTIRVLNGQRDRLRKYLTEQGVGTEIYYPIPLHQQACFRSLNTRPGSLPETELAAGQVLSLPIFPTMSPIEQQTVVLRIAHFFGLPEKAGGTTAIPALATHRPTSQPLHSL